jgi:hypothetical protein
MNVWRWDRENPQQILFLDLARIPANKPFGDMRRSLSGSDHRIAGELCARSMASINRDRLQEVGIMKNFASPSFYRTFDLLLGTINPGAKLSYWTYDDVEWVRDRYSITGRTHGIIIEIFTLTRPGRRGWSVMVTKENWWAGTESEAIKSSRWARPTSGRRSDIMEWFREQELELDRSSQAIPRTASHSTTVGSAGMRSHTK